MQYLRILDIQTLKKKGKKYVFLCRRIHFDTNHENTLKSCNPQHQLYAEIIRWVIPAQINVAILLDHLPFAVNFIMHSLDKYKKKVLYRWI